jgi:hypothetical protein
MRQRDERGAVGTIVGVLLAMGVVFGFLAISVDVGSLLWERRQLQNAADAAALSLATECGTGANCATAGNLQAFVDSNSNDGTSTVLSKCAVNMPASGLPLCGPPASGSLSQCPGLPPALAAMTGLPYVEVRTESRTSSGSGEVANWFAGVSGGSNSSSSDVRACARAAVGTPGSGSGELPITLSACEWQRATGGLTGGGGGYYYPPPVYGPTSPKGYGGGAPVPNWPVGAQPAPATPYGQEVVLLVQNPPGGQTPPSPCPNWQGHALPGGFGILETVTGNPCKIREFPFAWMHTNPGSSVSCNLEDFVGTVVSVPVFDCNLDYLPNRAPIIGAGGDPCNTGNGSNAYYHRVGYAAFYLSGYGVTTTGSLQNRVPSINPNSTATLPANANPCENSATCVSGWFTTASLSATSISGPPSGAGYFGTLTTVPAG